ncbi:hypothetical protein B0H13DRAFT_2405521 [Mycena leptocephala]|nr:hypothetical protein B0H13DRAFT_2405521 [Mycena leptocephala]
MSTTVRDLILILQLFCPGELSIHKAFYVLGVIISLYPALRLHLNQRRQSRQLNRTAWTRNITKILVAAFDLEDKHPPTWALGLDRGQEFAQHISDGLAPLYTMLGLNPEDLAVPSPDSLFPVSRIILCTSRLSCIFCPAGDLNIVPTLRRRVESQTVRLLDRPLNWVEAELLIAHCASCRADYFPDRITYRDRQNARRERLELSPDYLRASKHGVWVDKQIALLQENSLHRFHARWSNFADWVNDSVPFAEDAPVPSTGEDSVPFNKRKFTYRQSQRLFIEHFSRRLLLTHQKSYFSCEAYPSTRLLAEAVRAAIGVNGGILDAAMTHGCVGCTHLKRYRPDLIAEGAILGGDPDVAGEENEENAAVIPVVQSLPQQDTPPPGQPRGYVRMAVMDGKIITHRANECERPLVNYKNGRFCDAHLNLRDVCGIVPCGLPVRHPGALTCTAESHIAWQRQYENRFARLSFPGVHRGGHGPALHISLAALGNTPGDQVVHTFKAKTTYFLQTIQLACGFPIGWGKCYRSESTPQVLAILNQIWEHHPNSRPSFIAYDDACHLLRHIVTQNPNDPWLSTKFIVDAWHYLGHRATDILCRLWCNPAPKNGSQPDLVLVEEDANGICHQTRAFNTETAEQLNSWLNGFESQLRQISDVNYDFFVHILMMIYAEKVQKQVVQKNQELSATFWAEATGSIINNFEFE